MYVAHLNPTDKRGCRSIVRMIDNLDMQSTVNREFDESERIGLKMFSHVIQKAYSKIFPLVQSSEANNNTYWYDTTFDKIVVGTSYEPNFLHEHIWGRGDPNYQYVRGVPLDGPSFGEEFHMKGHTPHIKGNDAKVAWTEAQQKLVVNALRSQIEPKQISELKVYTSGTLSYWVRHGETDYNKEQRIQGQWNVHLNETGIAQAQKASRTYPKHFFDTCYTSDLSRAKLTSEILTDGIDLEKIQDSRLRERDARELTGVTVSEYNRLCHISKVESDSEMTCRINSFINDLHVTHQNKDILVVTHGGVIRNVLKPHISPSDLKMRVANLARFVMINDGVTNDILMTRDIVLE